MPSVLRVIEREWLAWLKRGPKAHGLKTPNATDREIHKGGFEAAEPLKGCRGAEIDLGRSDRPRIRADRGAG
jgi:hypothetical protein